MYTKFTQEIGEAIEALRRQKWTVGFAESCTGGRLSALWAEVPGVSDVFLGSVISYSNQVKMDLLGVASISLTEVGAVSSEVALQMVRGLKKSLRVDWAVAVTGIAGPGGGTPSKPVGTVWFAIAGPGFEDSVQEHFSGNRVQVQNSAAGFATGWLNQTLKQN